MSSQVKLTVREVIALLQSLPESELDKPLVVMYDCGCASTWVYRLTQSQDVVFLEGD